jgi:hypothetical protein
MLLNIYNLYTINGLLPFSSFKYTYKMKASSIVKLILLLAPALALAHPQQYAKSEASEVVGEQEIMEGEAAAALEDEAPAANVENIYTGTYFPAVVVASFTGPSIVGEFSFYQDAQGDVTATGALQRGLKQDVRYKFRFHEGPSCDNLGPVVLEHEFETMHVVDLGGTPPIQELIPGIHLTGNDGFSGAPWVLADEHRDLACVILKGPD